MIQITQEKAPPERGEDSTGCEVSASRTRRVTTPPTIADFAIGSSRRQIASIWSDSALDTQMSPLQSTLIVSPWTNRMVMRTAAIPAIIAP